MVVDAIINTVVPLLGELGIFAIAATVVGWVARDVITQYFDKELAKYQTEVEKELNRYQTELDKERTKFSELHNKRAKVTADLYKKFVEFEEDLRTLTHPLQKTDGPSKSEKISAAAESGNQFLNFYMKNKIYFPPDVCETVEDIVEASMDIHKAKRVRAAKFAHRQMEPEDFEKELEHWERVAEEDIPELKEELENHFRELLGVELGEQTTTD